VTLTDLNPCLQRSLPDPLEPWLWPASTQHLPGGGLAVGGVDVGGMTARNGAPTKFLDLNEFRGRCLDYRKAFYDGEVAYAGKALLTADVLRLVDETGLSLTVSSAAELEFAAQHRFPMERVLLHAHEAAPALLLQAVMVGVGRIVLDAIDQIDSLARFCSVDSPQQVLLRVAPRLAAPPRTATPSGQPHGLCIGSGVAAHAVRHVVAEPSLELIGFHCHLGSQITSVTAYEEAARQLLLLRAGTVAEHHLTLPELNLGGGHAIAYHPENVPLWPWALAAALRRVVQETCEATTLPAPRVTVEPGRSIARPCGVTVFAVTDVKRVADRVWVTVNGGLRDYLSPVPRGQRHTARLLGRMSSAKAETVSVIGHTAGVSEVLIDEVLLAADIRPGDLLAIPATGSPVVSNRLTCVVPQPVQTECTVRR
jgi:diaminopimelate decarboxylase